MGLVVSHIECLAWRNAARDRGVRVVFTNGCFDLLHRGHLEYLRDARALGGALIVGVNGDAGVTRLKGPGRPLMPAEDRAALLAALEPVDRVVLFDEDTPARVIELLAPDVLVKGGDYGLDEIVGRDTVERAGGLVTTIPLLPGRSTSAIIAAARRLP
jgi:D-beta-D-heptose 7-phosphate kinase/D-beta-D-heptose 1-phosphate adenosyltransferase